MGSWSYGYDVNSNLITQTDALNQTISFSYDALSRLITKTYPAGSPATYSYDSGPNGKGHRTGMSNTNGNTNWNYDIRGRVITTTTSVTGLSGSRSFGNSYDSADRITSLTYPSLSSPTIAGETVNYAYDYAWRLSSASSSQGTYVSSTSYGFDSSHHLNQKQWTLGNGLIQTWYYDSRGEVNQQVVGTSSNLASLFNRAYWYDNIGNITNSANYINYDSQQYSYDDLNRLKSWTLNSNTENYSYDTIGNITNKVAASYSYTATVGTRTLPHAVSQTVNGGTTQNYSYDANGNMLTGGGRSYSWNYDNKPSSITGSDGVTETYSYDADGARVKRTRAGVTTYYVGGSWEEDSTGLRKSYYLFGTQVIAQRDSANVVTYLHGDYLGSTSLTTNSSGASLSQQEFDPWGKVRSGGVSQTTMNYTGQKLDGTGLLFYNARYYDPAIGRFTSADIVIDGLNRYSYTSNNPLRFTDPSGFAACDTGSDSYKKTCSRLALGYDPVGLSDLGDGRLDSIYNWLMKGIVFIQSGLRNWTGRGVDIMMQSLDRVYNYFSALKGGNEAATNSAVKNALGLDSSPLVFDLTSGSSISGNLAQVEGQSWGNTVKLNEDQFGDDTQDKEFLIINGIHELGHIVDWHLNNTPANGSGWSTTPGGVYENERNKAPGAVNTKHAADAIHEDFADTFAWLVQHNEVNNNGGNEYVQRGYVNPSLGRRNEIEKALNVKW